MIEVTPKEKPIVGKVQDMPKREQEKPAPVRRGKRKRKVSHAAISGSASTFFFGIAGAAFVLNEILKAKRGQL